LSREEANQTRPPQSPSSQACAGRNAFPGGKSGARGEPPLPHRRHRRLGRGLEALGLFLANVPRDSGMAFVIVQHLDPTHKGIMVSLLQRGTAMPVAQVKDRTRIKPNCVYVIPPNKDMSILHGVLHLLDPVAPRGQRLPIESFFRSLADDRQEHSIGVILSGMGSDGTLGLHAIKESASPRCCTGRSPNVAVGMTRSSASSRTRTKPCTRPNRPGATGPRRGPHRRSAPEEASRSGGAIREGRLVRRFVRRRMVLVK
jgi:hypothetical protein